MSAKILKLDPTNFNQDLLKEPADILANGGLVIIPTETVYGIAANKLNLKTLDKLYEIKKRPENKHFSLHIADKFEVESFAIDIPVSAYKLMDKFWPGPLTLVLKSKEKNTIGIRLPDDKIAQALIQMSSVPIVCPSANISGKPAPKNFIDAIEDFKDSVDFAIDAGPTKLQLESSVVDLTINPPNILREGVIKKEDILKTVQTKNILFVCTGNSCRSVMAEAYLKKLLKDKTDVKINSAGISALEGMSATYNTIEVLKKIDLDVTGHRAKFLTDVMLKSSDLILVMEKHHQDLILERVPLIKNHVYLLKEFAKIDDGFYDIKDPIGQSPDVYEEVFNSIKQAVDRIAKLI
ncbi:MAG: L-threonylcarbamoyladenylate synthase [Candidatus Omnitrophota bacterium]